MAFKYELGSKVECKITGYKGVITARHEWLYGCRRYTLQARELKDGKPVDTHYLDEDAIQLLEAAEPHHVRDTGGGDAPTRSSQPPRHGS